MPKVDTNGHKQKIINPKTWRLINGWEVLIKHPLINDFLYGERVDNQTYKLHCYLIEFDHPYSDEKKTLLSPPDFY